MLYPDSSAIFVTAPGFSRTVFSLPPVVDDSGGIDRMKLFLRPSGDPRLRRACFVAVFFWGTELKSCAIVEGPDTFSEPRALEVTDLIVEAVLNALEAAKLPAYL